MFLACSADTRVTTGPRFGVDVTRPSDSRWRRASRTEVRLTFVHSHSWRSMSRSPGLNRPVAMAFRSTRNTCVRTGAAVALTRNSSSVVMILLCGLGGRETADEITIPGIDGDSYH